MKHEIVWVLSGGIFYENAELIKRYALIEYDILERRIYLSSFERFIRADIYTGLDEETLRAINNELDDGRSFLCKEVISVNGNKVYNFGYYTKVKDQYRYIELKDYSKEIYKQYIKILIENCSL